MDEIGSRPWEVRDGEAPLAWGAWLRDRLEREPTWDDDATGDQEPSTAATIITGPPVGADPTVVAELRSLREAIDALSMGCDADILAELRSLRGEVAALSAHAHPGVAADLASIQDALAALPTTPDPQILTELRALREAVTAPTTADRELAAKVEALAEQVASLVTRPDPVVDELHALRDEVEAMLTAPHPAVVDRLRSLEEAVAALPTGPDADLVAGMEALTDAFALLPVGPDPAVVDGLQTLRETVAALPTGPHPDVVEGLHALREVTEALVDLVAGFPTALLAVNQKVDEHTRVLAQVLSERRSDVSELQRLGRSVIELRDGVTKEFRHLSGWMQLVTTQQTRARSTGDTTREIVTRMAKALAGGEASITIRLDQTQIRAIATSVAEMVQESSSTGGARRTMPIHATRSPNEPRSA